MTNPRVRDALIAFTLLSVASLSPIWSNDYFWHLATGQWMFEHGRLPVADPLAVASSQEPWINAEWLFQLAAMGLYRLGGHDLIAAARAVAIGAVFTLLFVRLSRQTEWFTASCVTLFAWYGALTWLRERPATAGALLLLALLLVLEKRMSAGTAAALFVLVAVWANVHPSALLAPGVVFLAGAAMVVEKRSFGPAAALAVIGATAVAGAALAVNPYGIDGVLNPFRVARIAQMPIFRNEEWAATSFREYPLFALALLACVALIATSARRERWLPAAIVLAVLAVLAVRFVRNQALFYVAAPLLLAPHIRPVPARIRRLLVLPVALTVVAIVANSDFAAGVDRNKFPVTASRVVRDLSLPGNVFSDYGMGGFLVWSFAPERRVLTDGRNELFVEYQRGQLEARRSSEAWRRFLRAHDAGVAFVSRRSSPVWTRDAATGARRAVPEWDVYFPEKEWALVAVDNAAVAFADRQRTGPAAAAAEIPRSALQPQGK